MWLPVEAEVDDMPSDLTFESPVGKLAEPTDFIIGVSPVNVACVAEGGGLGMGESDEAVCMDHSAVVIVLAGVFIIAAESVVVLPPVSGDGAAGKGDADLCVVAVGMGLAEEETLGLVLLREDTVDGPDPRRCTEVDEVGCCCG